MNKDANQMSEDAKKIDSFFENEVFVLVVSSDL